MIIISSCFYFTHTILSINNGYMHSRAYQHVSVSMEFFSDSFTRQHACKIFVLFNEMVHYNKPIDIEKTKE